MGRWVCQRVAKMEGLLVLAKDTVLVSKITRGTGNLLRILIISSKTLVSTAI